MKNGLVDGVVVETVKESIKVENGLFDYLVVGSVKELVEGNNRLGDDQLFASDSNQDCFREVTNVEKTEYIDTHDVLNSKSLESTKDGLEEMTGNGGDNKEWYVGSGDFQNYAVGLMRVENAILSRLHECLVCLGIFSFSHEYAHKERTEREYILTNIQVFDPGGKRVFDFSGAALVVMTTIINTVKASIIMIHVDNFSRLEFELWKWPMKKKLGSTKCKLKYGK